VHTLPGVFFVFSFDGRKSLVVRSADWSPEITGGGDRRNLPVHPCGLAGRFPFPAQPYVLYTIQNHIAN